jgi:beta-N-acetylhexosaminidase
VAKDEALEAIPPSATIDFWSDYPASALADALVERMSNEELYAQILMFGWSGTQPSALLNQWVETRSLGSVKLFGWNTDDTMQVARSVIALQEKAGSGRFKIPLFVATDQEGGMIRHVKGATSLTPGNLAIGAAGFPRDAWYSGYYINRELRALGINMNFAPTVDIYSNLGSTVIGSRSFGDDPDAAGILGVLFAQGSLEAGVIPTAKHFPGHGDTDADSHGRLPVIDIDRESFIKRELLPFRYLIESDVPAIMSGHLSFPRIIPDGKPASLSKVFLTDFLRGDLGFQGLIITDDMRMYGATVSTGSLAESYRLAIEAGNDIIISSLTALLNEPCWSDNLARMGTDAAFRDCVKKAARRVIFTKLRYFRGDLTRGAPAPILPDREHLSEAVPDREGENFFLAMACRSITVAPVPAGKAKQAFAPEKRLLFVGETGALGGFFTSARARYANLGTFALESDFSLSGIPRLAAAIAREAPRYDGVVVCVSDFSGAALVKSLRSLETPLAVISILSPIPAFDLDWADTLIFTYSASPWSFTAAIAALAGDYVPQGTLPLKK